MEDKFQFICDHKYIFHDGKKVIAFGVNLENLPDVLMINNYKLLKRSEFHISLFCIQRAIKKYNINVENFENKAQNDFCVFIKTKEIKFINYKNEFRFVEKENQKTLVVMCEVSNLNEFFDFINQKYSLSIEYPPTHVTLYTLDGETGIALLNEEDIKNLTKTIPNPIGSLL